MRPLNSPSSKRFALTIFCSLFGIACGQALEPPAATETLTVATSGAKGDSIRTHELEITVADTDHYSPRGWGPSEIHQWIPSVEVTDHSDEHVSVTIDELIFRPPADIQDQIGQGWMTFISGQRGSFLEAGTSFSILVWWRPAGSDAEWKPIEMPTEESADMGRYFQAFAVDEGDEPESASLSDIPHGRCELVSGTSNGPDDATLETSARLPELDDDGANEFRIWVVPNYNFCEWTDGVWHPEVIVTPINTGYWNTA